VPSGHDSGLAALSYEGFSKLEHHSFRAAESFGSEEVSQREESSNRAIHH
jgi:hypothetical protein